VERTEADAVAELAQPQVQIIDSFNLIAPVLVTRDAQGRPVSESLEHLLADPVRIAEKQRLGSVASFIGYVNRFKADGTTLFADRAANCVEAALEYHVDAESPRRDGHDVTLGLRHTRAMANWLGAVNKRMSQEDFALFLEDNAIDIVDPGPVAMIEAAAHFRAVKDVQFESKVGLDNGSLRFNYVEEVRAGTSQPGQVAMPEKFTLALTPYEGMLEAAAFRLEARVRYTVGRDGLKLWFAIPLLQRAMDQAFDEVLASIEKETGFVPYRR
jgi:uncharacterized protein YfdQ (DUF2303 family)